MDDGGEVGPAVAVEVGDRVGELAVVCDRRPRPLGDRAIPEHPAVAAGEEGQARLLVDHVRGHGRGPPLHVRVPDEHLGPAVAVEVAAIGVLELGKPRALPPRLSGPADQSRCPVRPE